MKHINPVVDTYSSNEHHYFYDIHPDYSKPVPERVYLISMIESKPRQTLPFLLLGLGLLLITASVFYIFQENAPRSDLSTVPAQVNFAAPELTLTDTQNVERSLKDYRGQVVLVNLWATWCPPCKEEMPALQALYNKYADQGFTIIAINDGEPAPDVLQFVKDYQLTFPVWLDPTYIATEQAFKSLNLPSSYVIDRTGTVRLMWVGGISKKMLDKYVPAIITEKL